METLKEKEEIIVVKGISLSHIAFTIVGYTPLVVNRFKTEDIDPDERNICIQARR